MCSPRWTLFDDVLCALADRLRALGCSNTLEVEIRVGVLEIGGEESHAEVLPKFKEKGLVRVVSPLTGQAREWTPRVGM